MGFPKTISFSIFVLECREQKSFLEKLIDLGRNGRKGDCNNRQQPESKLFDPFLRIAFVLSPLRSQDDFPHSFPTQFFLAESFPWLGLIVTPKVFKCQRKVVHFRKIYLPIFFISMSVARIRYLLIRGNKFAMLM